MSDMRFTVDVLFGQVKIDSWIEFAPAEGGGFNMRGMGRKRVFDQYGKQVSESVSATGVNGWSPVKFKEQIPA